MQRARRLVSVAAVASVAVTGLSACRNAPSVVAYIGPVKITESRVEAVFDDARDKLAAATPAQPDKPLTMPITRADVVRALLSVQVLAAVAKQKGLTLPAELGLADYATSLHLPETTEYIRLFATSEGYVKALREGVRNPPEPTDADLREVYDMLLASGQSVGGSFDEFKSSLPEQNKQLVQTATAVRQTITGVADTMSITINPKYQPVAISVLQFQTGEGRVQPLVTARLGGTDAAPVTDLR